MVRQVDPLPFLPVFRFFSVVCRRRNYMQAYDNFGNLISEINTCYVDGKVITTQTSYNNYGVNNQRVISQNITVRDMNTGKVSSQNILGGKLLP